jgi:hypothetical protein
MIVDTHFHIPDYGEKEAYQKNSALARVVDWLNRARQAIGERTRVEDMTEEALLALMDECGIDVANLHALSTRDEFGFDFVPNKRVLHFVRKYPGRFVGNFEVDPRQGKAALEQMERYAQEEGIVGMKMNPNFFGGFFYNDRGLCYPLYEKALELGLPVMMHTGPTPAGCRMKHNAPILVDDVATDFPDLVIIIDHMGYPWSDVCYQVGMTNPNVYVGLAATFNVMVASAPLLAWQELGILLAQVGARKIVWGSYTPSVGGVKASIDFIRGKPPLPLRLMGMRGLSEEEKALILGCNVARIFGL